MSDEGEAQSATAAPGWYPDPVADGLERWWDGSTWTQSLRPRLAVPTPPPVPTPPDRTPAPKGPRAPLWRSQKVLSVLMAVALIGAGVGAFLLIRTGLGAFTASTFSTPGEETRELDAGTYTVFEHVGGTTQAGPVTVTNVDGPALQARDVQVEGSGGQSVAVTPPRLSETVTRGRAIYEGSASFEVRDAGEYTIRISGPRSEVFVARKLFDGASGPLTLFLVSGALGASCAVALFVIVLVKSSRRRALR